MDKHFSGRRCGIIAVAAAVSAILCWESPRPQAQDNPPQPADVEVLARGPIHEAFAEPVVFNPRPGAIVEADLPVPIEELPTEQTIVGDNVAWIPGYSVWDIDRKDFIWVSGFWRVIPPGRQWVPGYWTKVAGGSQWVSGFWAPTEHEELEYLPTPPQTLEQGPSTLAPSPNHFWVSGCWNWRDNRYLWRPGYWTIAQTNWMWVPSYYAWTPQGCVFIPGYWDYVMPQRGLLYAPVYFSPVVYTRPSFFFTPRMGIDVALVTNHFFVNISSSQYYFGDYYQPAYLSIGFQPYFAFHRQNLGYCPLYAYNQQQHRHDRNWESQLHRDYEHRRDHAEARPPQTLAAMNTALAGNGSSVQQAALVKPIQQIVAKPDSKIQMRPLEEHHRQELAHRAHETNRLSDHRRTSETSTHDKPVAGKNATDKPVTDKTATDKPIAEKPATDQSANGKGSSDKPTTAGVATGHDAAKHEHHSVKMPLPKSPISAPATGQSNTAATGRPQTSTSGAAHNERSPAQRAREPAEDQRFRERHANETQAAPKKETQSVPKPSPAPQPKAEAVQPPKPAPRPEPKPEAAPRPRTEPTPPPRSEKKPDPPHSPKTEGKGKDKK